MLKKLLLVAVATVAFVSSVSSANAGWWWNSRPSQPSYSSGYNDYQLIIRQSLGHGTDMYYSTPAVQYGSPSINYQFNNDGSVDPYRSGIIQRRGFGW